MQKINAYLGFAIKSGNLIKGVDKIIENKKPVYVVLYSSLADNSLSKLMKFVAYNKIDIFKVTDEVLPLGSKAIALTDQNLARVIKEKLKNVEDC